MKRFALLPVAAILAFGPTAAFSADAHMNGPPPPHVDGAPNERSSKHFENMTLEEARTHAKDRMERLSKMTPEEWEAHKKKRMERREKWEHMSPTERDTMKERMKEKRKTRTGTAESEGE